MTIDLRTSSKIANLGLVMAMLVVVDHSQGPCDRGSLAWWIMEVLSNGVCKVAVPFFFVVSGFFLARHLEQKNWWWPEVGQSDCPFFLRVF